MSENKISYLNRNYDEYKSSLIELTKNYYPDVFNSLNDASVGEWFIELLSDIGDSLQFHIDRVVQETTVDSANQTNSLLNIARTNGLRIPGRKCAICEVEISFILPLCDDNQSSKADENYAPILKRGCLFSTGSVTFELMENVDFADQFNEDGRSNRQIIPVRDSNGTITSYKYKKLAICSASRSKIYKKVITSSDIKPFMEILLQDDNIVDVESIIIKDGTTLNTDPAISEFFYDDEDCRDSSGEIKYHRFFEVDSLIDQQRFGQTIQKTDDGKYNPVWETVSLTSLETNSEGKPITIDECKIAKGEWKPLKRKFITEFNDNWALKVIFGAGIENVYGNIPTDAENFTKYMMSRMEANDYLGILPEADKTLYILYRVGGGEISNIAKDTLTNIVYSNMTIKGDCDRTDNATRLRDVRNSMAVTNTTPSYGGKDEPTDDEIKYLIKYNNSAQNRCVTVHDYYNQLNKMPAKYGSPFRIGVIEENNRVSIYTLGLDFDGKLTRLLSETVAENMKEYLKKYKMITDYVEIKSGKIINIGFEITLYVDKDYDKAEVAKRLIDTTYDYMDIRSHVMGEDIYLGDLQKELSKLDGVTNIVKMSCFNPHGADYSDTPISQEYIDFGSCCNSYNDEYANTQDYYIDLDASDYILYGEPNAMFEIKYKEKDIRVIVKSRN